jgi:hypothetical protein
MLIFATFNGQICIVLVPFSASRIDFFAKTYGLLIAAPLFANFEDKRVNNGSENEKHISTFQIRSNSLYPNTYTCYVK